LWAIMRVLALVGLVRVVVAMAAASSRFDVDTSSLGVACGRRTSPAANLRGG